MQKENSKKHGFTLAEILITLTVIGVVAALTIPTLLQNTNQAELKTTWKRSFADLTQATEMIKNDNGGSLTGLCSDYDDTCLKNVYKPYLGYIKECDYNTAYGNCWLPLGKFYSYDGSTTSGYNPAGFILKNGQLLLVRMHTKACDLPVGNVMTCGWLGVDVNGFKPPNTYGKDEFMMYITANRAVPSGTDDSGVNCQGSGGWSGTGCSAKYLYE